MEPVNVSQDLVVSLVKTITVLMTVSVTGSVTCPLVSALATKVIWRQTVLSFLFPPRLMATSVQSP